MPRNAGRRRSLVPDRAGKKTPYWMLSADGCPEVGIWEVGARQSLGFLARGRQYTSKAPKRSASGQGPAGA